MSKKSKSTTTIKLTGIKPENVDAQYGLNPLNMKKMELIPVQSTKISDLNSIPENIQFIDELKNNNHCKISMVRPSLNHKLYCFWDRHIIDDPKKIVYCPIDKITKPDIKIYESNINGKIYKIQDSITGEEAQEYHTDGIFCSTECCLAFIRDRRNDPLYQYSEYYLNQIYAFDSKCVAPNWRLLSCYGGSMDIVEFRKSFTNITYVYDGIIFNPICFVFKENYHL